MAKTDEVNHPEIMENVSTVFGEDPELGIEFIKVFLKEEGNGMKVQVIHKQGIENKLPKEFIAYVMNNIGNFMVHAIKALKEANEQSE